MDTNMIIGAGLPALTGNAWVDSMIIFGSTLGFALLVSKAKKEFFPKEPEPMRLSPSPLHVRKSSEAATKDDIAKLEEVFTSSLKSKANQSDFSRLEKEVEKLECEVKETERHIIKKLDENKESVVAAVKEFSDEARKGRVEIWGKLNESKENLTDRVSKLEGKIDE